MKKNYLILSFLCIFSLVSNFTNSANEIKKMNITVIKNKVEAKYAHSDNVVARPQRRFQEPNYYISLMSSLCQFSISIDNILVFNFRSNNLIKHAPMGTNVNGNIPINNVLLNTGLHTVTACIYPLSKQQTLDYMSTLDLSYTMRDQNNFKDEERIFRVKADTLIPGKNGLKGLPYYEFSKTFYAEVPFHIEGWSKSVNLEKYDQQKLKTEINQAYNHIHQLIAQKDTTKLDLISQDFDNIRSVSFYISKTDLQSYIQGFNEEICDPDYQLAPLPDNAFLQIMANGKLVSLVDSIGNPIIRLVNKKDPTDVINLEFKFHKKTENSPLSVI